ncbi:hypothetical protein ACWDBF_22725 [Streptomyces angustmyceticus]
MGLEGAEAEFTVHRAVAVPVDARGKSVHPLPSSPWARRARPERRAWWA